MTGSEPPAEMPVSHSARRVGVVLPAAGLGRRLGGVKKAWLQIAEEPILAHALRPFLEEESIVAIRVAVGPDEVDAAPEWLTTLDPRVEVAPGGETRAESVRNAVLALPDVDVIMVHDAARPLVDSAVISRCIAALDAPGVDGAVAGVPATDTVKLIDELGAVVETPDRRRVWLAQTPQAFDGPTLRSLYDRLDEIVGTGPVTDDASLMEREGLRVVMVDGSVENFKVTHPDDVVRAELVLSSRKTTA